MGYWAVLTGHSGDSTWLLEMGIHTVLLNANDCIGCRGQKLLAQDFIHEISAAGGEVPVLQKEGSRGPDCSDRLRHQEKCEEDPLQCELAYLKSALRTWRACGSPLHSPHRFTSLSLLARSWWATEGSQGSGQTGRNIWPAASSSFSFHFCPASSLISHWICLFGVWHEKEP